MLKFMYSVKYMQSNRASEQLSPITFVGYCIVLAESTSKWKFHPADLQENLKAVQELLKTDEQPKWYLDPQRY
jgi:hypothetical protein